MTNRQANLHRITDNLLASWNETDGVIELTTTSRVLGRIFANAEDWQKIKEGANPIEEGWEDGIGNIVSWNGWGKFAQEEE